MNGLELATRIKKDEKHNKIKFIINSSRVDEEYIKAFGEIGIIKENIYFKLDDMKLIKKVVENTFDNSQK